tara:strand:+ start:835 stop:1224 length:390 start_codon:yes stop_codon:yes gene_type:complete
MDEIVLRAKLILSHLFSFDTVHFERHTTRTRDIMEGRRFLMYFLREDIGMTFFQIKKYIPALTNHATIIHHCRKMRELLDVEKSLKRRYNLFKSQMLDGERYVIETEIIKKTEQRKKINNELYKLKKLL